MIVPGDTRPASHLDARVNEIVAGGSRQALDVAVDLALLLARAGAGERRVLWTVATPWLPATIEAATRERPELGAGWLLDGLGNPIRGGAYPTDLAREALALRNDDLIVLVRQHRHPARSLRGAIRYMDRLWLLRYRLDRHAGSDAHPAVMLERATA